MQRLGTFSHMVTVTSTPFVMYCTTASLPSAGDSYKQHKNIIITGQEINTHKINKYITSSDLLLQYQAITNT